MGAWEVVSLQEQVPLSPAPPELAASVVRARSHHRWCSAEEMMMVVEMALLDLVTSAWGVPTPTWGVKPLVMGQQGWVATIQPMMLL
jgi:hypothetical protein